MAEEVGFFQKIYMLTAQIPPGQVATYGQLASLAGKPCAARLAGQAMSHAPEGLPCHRVIRADGMLSDSGLFGGMQRQMLQMEGVGFLSDGRVDLARCRWQGKSASAIDSSGLPEL